MSKGPLSDLIKLPGYIDGMSLWNKAMTLEGSEIDNYYKLSPPHMVEVENEEEKSNKIYIFLRDNNSKFTYGFINRKHVIGFLGFQTSIVF